jgi:hypothetical protein
MEAQRLTSIQEVPPTMSFTDRITRDRCRMLAGALGVALVFASPAAAAGPREPKVAKSTAANPLNCVVDHALSNPFSAWDDHADYALAPGGDFETAAAGWTLSGGASVTAGNQPFAIGTVGRSSLRLPAGSSATSPPMCIDSSYPHFRVFARHTGRTKSELRAEVLFLNQKGDVKSSASGTVVATSPAWSPTGSLRIGVTFNTAVAGGAAPVAFRFTSGKDVTWQIDDVYVDPRMRR